MKRHVWLTFLFLATCTKLKPFQWETADGIVCDPDAPTGGVATNHLECNRPADWECDQPWPERDAGLWRPCWRVGPVDPGINGLESYFDGPWQIEHGCCCEPDCGSGVNLRWTPRLLICDPAGYPPPEHMACVDGGVVWTAK